MCPSKLADFFGVLRSPRGALKCQLADKGSKRVPTFLNRLLAMTVRDQGLLFTYFQVLLFKPLDALLSHQRLLGALSCV